MYSQYDAFEIQCEKSIRDAEATGDAVKISATILGCDIANSIAVDHVAKELLDDDSWDGLDDKRTLSLESARLAIGDAEARHADSFEKFLTRSDEDSKLTSGMIIPSNDGNIFIQVKDSGEIGWTSAETDEQHALVGQFAEEMKSVLDENLKTLGLGSNQNEKIIDSALANIDFSIEEDVELSR